MAYRKNRPLEKNMTDKIQEESHAVLNNMTHPHYYEDANDLKKKRSTWIFVSLLTLLFLVTLANGFHFNGNDETSSHEEQRGLASIGDSPRKHSTRSTKWEHEIAKNLAKKPARASASLGRPPTELQRLLFERLSGNYSVRLNQDGKLQEILFVDQGHSEDHLTYVDNPVEFISDYKNMMPGSFSDALMKSTQIADNRKLEIYVLRDAEGLLLGEAHFELDLSGRLRKLLLRETVSN